MDPWAHVTRLAVTVPGVRAFSVPVTTTGRGARVHAATATATDTDTAAAAADSFTALVGYSTGGIPCTLWAPHLATQWHVARELHSRKWQ